MTTNKYLVPFTCSVSKYITKVNLYSVTRLYLIISRIEELLWNKIIIIISSLLKHIFKTAELYSEPKKAHRF